MSLEVFYISVRVEFTRHMWRFSSRMRLARTVAGFFQEFGCTATSLEKAQQIVTRHIEDDFPGNICKISFEHCGLIHQNEFEKEIYDDDEISGSKTFSNPRQECIWYYSGHGFYYAPFALPLIGRIKKWCKSRFRMKVH